uniref:Cell division protein ZapB n=1 Tax=Fervidobacterium thailandense TaxID=1008305 RepID=A0A7C4W3F7_9BACT
MVDKVDELERLIEGLITSYSELKRENEKLWQELNRAIERISELEKEKSELERLLRSNEEVINKLIIRVKDLMNILEVSDHEEG